MLSSNEELSAETMEEIQWYRANPIELNSCTKDQIDALPVLSGFQKSSLWEYLSRERPVQSIYELQYILGFGLADAQLLAEFAQVRPPGIPAPKYRRRTRQDIYYATGRSLRATDGNQVQQISGLAEQKHSLKYRIEHQGVSAGITAENDAGERFRMNSQQIGPDYASAYLAVEYPKTAIIAGDYELRWGQGLAIWQGYNFGKSSAPADVRKSSKYAVPHRSTEENRFMRGAAVAQTFGNTSITVAASSQLRDGSASEDSSFSQYYTGIHHTANEISKRDQLRLNTLAGRFRMETPTVRGGIQILSHQWEAASGQALYDKEGYSRLQVASADFSAGGNGLIAFGEIAADSRQKTAAIAGIQANPAPGVELCIAARDYAPRYGAIDPGGMAEYSGTANERGIYVGASGYAWHRLQLSGYYDLFAAPQPRFRQSYPSVGSEYTLSVQYNLGESSAVTIRHSQQTKQLDISRENSPSPTRQMPESCKSSYSIKVRTGNDNIPLSAGLYHTTYSHAGTREQGSLIFVQIQPRLGKYLRIAYQAAAFSTTYNTRIYLYEPHLPLSMSVPAHIGSGMKNIIRADVRIKRTHLSLKYAHWNTISDYLDRPTKTCKHDFWASFIAKI